MDLYVERQCIHEIKKGNLTQFLLLFDATFSAVYKYVFRRVAERVEAERIITLTYLDALSKVQEIPTDISFAVWLYSLAKPRVFSYINKSSFPEKQGLISVGEKADLDKVSKMFAKLSMEEREILKLKFFEEVTDGDVMTVLGEMDGSIGAKIYRVLKRAHFLLFGESDEKHGVYFGEISGLLSKVRDSENIEVSEPFRLSLRADLNNRIDKRSFAINAEEERAPEESPWVKREAKVEEAAKGSSDPAKVFTDAVKDMSDEEREAWRTGEKEEEIFQDFEGREMLLAFFERWKFVLALVPAILIVVITGIFLYGSGFFDKFFLLARGYPTECSVEVNFDGKFADVEKMQINKLVSDRLCDHFEVGSEILIAKGDDDKLNVQLDVKDWFLEYDFVKKETNYRIKKYARTLNSDEESGEVQGDS